MLHSGFCNMHVTCMFTCMSCEWSMHVRDIHLLHACNMHVVLCYMQQTCMSCYSTCIEYTVFSIISLCILITLIWLVIISLGWQQLLCSLSKDCSGFLSWSLCLSEWEALISNSEGSFRMCNVSASPDCQCQHVFTGLLSTLLLRPSQASRQWYHSATETEHQHHYWDRVSTLLPSVDARSVNTTTWHSDTDSGQTQTWHSGQTQT